MMNHDWYGYHTIVIPGLLRIEYAIRFRSPFLILSVGNNVWMPVMMELAICERWKVFVQLLDDDDDDDDVVAGVGE